MSSSTAATMDSRPSSPATPESSDGLHPVAIHNDSDLSSWFKSVSPPSNVTDLGLWDTDLSSFAFSKRSDHQMLQLNDVIDEHAYDDVDTSESSPSKSGLCTELPDVQLARNGGNSGPHPHTPAAHSPETGFSLPSQMQMRCTPVVPPPALQPRKQDPSTVPHKVVYPPRESCNNLPIITPSIPDSGTKSRVETQVRVTVDLAYSSSSALEPYQYDRVGSWKWLKLPPGTSTKKRTRREGKIDPTPLDMLHLTASVTCASPPNSQVLSCGSCRNREAKRVAKKLAARVRPVRSDSDSPGDGNERVKGSREDTTSIIQFNCPEVLDFASGSVVLPVRITCYCRHHREKVGFHVHITMMDHTGRVVGSGTTPPIMITDDHKSNIKPAQDFNESEAGWSRRGSAAELADASAPSKRKPKEANIKRRTKPYDTTARNQSTKMSPEPSIASINSPVTSPSVTSTAPNTRSPTPFIAPPSFTPLSLPQSDVKPLISDTGLDHVPSQYVQSPAAVMPDTADNRMLEVTQGEDASMVDHVGLELPQGLPSATVDNMTMSHGMQAPVAPSQAMPFLFYDPNTAPTLPLPKIHRLIPSCGPTLGGIEVTILGENFHSIVQLNCVFGDVTASSTQRWSDNTLVCILPPRATPGVVAVSFENLPKPVLPALFTYTDESDRALMELALQVVGLKMTGKIEEAKNVALRIVGTTGGDDSQSRPESGLDMMQIALSPSAPRDIRPLLLARSGEGECFETAMLKFLSVMDVNLDKQSGIPMDEAISHMTPNGQSLLHLAAALGFSALLEFLLARGIDIDARDRNGFTALHFAAFAGSQTGVDILLDAGADEEIVNALGQTAQDISPEGFWKRGHGFSDNLPSPPDSDEDDGESRWGDVESDVGEEIGVRRRLPRTRRREPKAQEASVQPQAENDPPLPSDSLKKPDDTTPNEKQAASFVDMIQRTLAQLQSPQGLMPNMSQLPIPHLPEMPAVPWNLPQLPMVFPVFIPNQGWTSLFGDKRDEQGAESKDDQTGSRQGAQLISQELRATWEKWMALAIATATLQRQQPVDEAPPVYTPRESEQTEQKQIAGAEQPDGDAQALAHAGPSVADRASRRAAYDEVEVAAQEVASFGYRPASKHGQKMQQKHDRMLVLFWIPILLVSLLWAFHNGIRFTIQAVKTTLTLKANVRS
ncbi:hypothetical protein CONPUDRAFT_152105 [Coniophora puteana RWD-64-598 SS2]|uniref:IPT/TIG domain-containing protein n=1 Tax=Coniophora puteana (strain RWD-64-598) TaxID=741705 RepID=A0A5M3MVI4_CONPW|nr:uncharacterized protein CONPUDRAFT_152105 [Coniophora puteana RWD-64-598 SS2]EIW83060.1 hypothetical protein CONPUDRAFT_152105 [Coniophora puteana RWD-64-598 SS2]